MSIRGMQVSPASIKENTIKEIQELLSRLGVYVKQPNTGVYELKDNLLENCSDEYLKNILVKISEIQELCSGDTTRKSQDTSYEQFILKLDIRRGNLEALVTGGLSSIKTTLERLNCKCLDTQSLTNILSALKEIIRIIDTPNIEKDDNTQEPPI